MAIRDIETINDEIKAYVVNNIQTVIDAINTEKGDTLLPNFDSNSYLLFESDDGHGMGVYPIFFLQGINPETKVSLAERVLKTSHEIDICVFISKTNNDDNDHRISLRYQRVLVEVFKDYIKPKLRDVYVSNITVMPIKDSNSESWHIVDLTIQVNVVY